MLKKSSLLYSAFILSIVLTGCSFTQSDQTTEMNDTDTIEQNIETNEIEEASATPEVPSIDRQYHTLTEPDFKYISEYLFSIKDQIKYISKDSVNGFANHSLHGFGYQTKVHARHFAAQEENPEAVERLDKMAMLADSIHREENTENVIDMMYELNSLIDELTVILNVNRNTATELAEEEYLQQLHTELQSRYDLTVVDDPSICANEEVFCFKYEDSLNTIVQMTFDNAQMEFYNLLLNYQLPEVPKEGDEPEGYSGIVFYENGYSFYKESKTLFRAPDYSFDKVKPTEDQMFGIVISLAHSYGRNFYIDFFRTKVDATRTFNGMAYLKEFARDKVVLDWIEESSEAIQRYMNAEDEDETLRIEAWKQLNYLGNVVDVYMYENNFNFYY
ncbi:hypothetical protein [Ureibacillus manganicus]|uniref:DUF4856 domain-containing protein n=1 Tax=Ureibacillus manganicus DSM 26584 TaxID=1384049 RepID=A0A0A3I408_9BACL|nr:hypothetical protein [Ureibacillus manganicus]KGR77398.1 hypothetical protein CD29_15130 [Ureibacillus manganicus DSM 26584]